MIPRTVICSIGNTIRGDDGVGPAIIDGIKESIGKRDDVYLIDCGVAPENFTGKIIGLMPERLVVIDVCELGKEPGHHEVIDLDRVKGQMLSTHNLPVTVFIEALRSGLPGCSITFIGIQPKRLGFLEDMSEECKCACNEISDNLISFIFSDNQFFLV